MALGLHQFDADAEQYAVALVTCFFF